MSSDALHYLTAGVNLSYRFADDGVAPRVRDGSLFAELDELEQSVDQPCFVTAHDVTDESCGLVAAHTYSVLDMKRVGDVRLIQLRNPWGEREFTGPWCDTDTARWTPEIVDSVGFKPAGDDGSFWMEWSDFTRFFGFVTVTVTVDPDAPTVTLQGRWVAGLTAGGREPAVSGGFFECVTSTATAASTSTSPSSSSSPPPPSPSCASCACLL